MSTHYLGSLNQSDTPIWAWTLSPLVSREVAGKIDSEANGLVQRSEGLKLQLCGTGRSGLTQP